GRAWTTSVRVGTLGASQQAAKQSLATAVVDGAAIPSAAGFQPAGAAYAERYIEDRLRSALETADVHRALIAAWFGRRNHGSDLGPFLVGQVALIARMATVMAAAGFLGPHAAPRESAPASESQEIQRVQ